MEAAMSLLPTAGTYYSDDPGASVGGGLLYRLRTGHAMPAAILLPPRDSSV